MVWWRHTVVNRHCVRDDVSAGFLEPAGVRHARAVGRHHRHVRHQEGGRRRRHQRTQGQRLR